MTAWDGNGYKSDLYNATFRFDWTKAPLSANMRFKHWAQEAALVKYLRATMHAYCRLTPDLNKCEVQLTWVVTTKGRRDVDNLYPLLKALCDGIVDAEVVPDDTPEYMVKHAPQILWIDKAVDVPHFEFTIKEIR